LESGKDDELSSLKVGLENELNEGDYHDVLEARAIRLQNRVRPILKALEFHAEPGALELIGAINHFKAKGGTITQAAPLEFLNPQERKAIVGAGGQNFRTSLYKCFLFIHTAVAIKSGNLNLNYSYKYRPLDDYMIGKDRWKLEKDQLLDRAGLKELANPQKVLCELDKALYRQYQTTNTNVINGKNPHLKILTSGNFRIATPALNEKKREPLQQFFPERHYVPLTEVLATVNRYCEFIKELQHWQKRHVRKPVSPRALYAGVMGLGCGIGTRKMGQISSQVTENELAHVVNWYFSLNNILAANDRVVGAMDLMDLPKIYQRSQDKLHTASDGQKFEVRTDSLNANYSFKYFGKGQGVSAYTFIDERNLLWHSLVFSAAERESAYVIDGLMRNDVVKSDIHSTDTHGYSEIIFAATHLLGFSYAPRIKNLKKQNLYIFRSRKNIDRSDWKITPDKYVLEWEIENNWDDILRLITTIKLKETTASDIFHRLNSYSKQHALYKSMKAFGQIIKSLFILRYLDELELRQAIEKQLNKVELANRFTRAVAVGNPREFTQAQKEDQEIAESCNRLIKNCVICWNYLYLSQKLARAETEKAKNLLLTAIATQSVVSWAHINLLGEYDFSDKKLQDSVGILPQNWLHRRAGIWQMQN
jgi:TnpA family transposase